MIKGRMDIGKVFVCLWAKFLLIISILNSNLCIIIETKQGRLRGQTEFSRGGREFHAFYGIPYAEPPVGKLRFEEPVPFKKWVGLFNATVLPPQCISQEMVLFGQEDCLYLNVYTPKIEKNSSLPVMVFVYGGKFMYGHALPSRYGPHYFMDENIIVITFHYRLGPFGFLSTGDEIMPGNYGLKDFVEVLRWVRRNIRSYGGDKDRVTIAGGSSGGVTTGLALVSSLARGLFHRCISQSGFPTDVMEPEFYRRLAFKFASFTSCRQENVTTSEQVKLCLKKIPAREIGQNINRLYTIGSIIPLIPYGPTIENEKVAGTFLFEQPSRLMGGNINVPWLLGMNSGEGGMAAVFTYIAPGIPNKISAELERNYRKYFPEIFDYGRNDTFELLNRKTDAIIERYFGDTRISENYEAFAKIFTSKYATRLKSSVNSYNGLKYVYYYDHRNAESFDKSYGNPTDIDLGVIHGDELISMFNCSESIKPVINDIDLLVSKQVIDLWVNFVKYGDPNGKKSEKIWHPTTSSKFSYLYIGNGKLRMETDLMKSECEFWEDIIS